ncbi:MAG: putative transposase [Candidatus Azotimanducaceae bacterium]|jgi:putative transposase
MLASKSAYYDGCKRGVKIIDHETWLLFHRMKALFTESKQSLGSLKMMQPLRKEVLR